MAYTTSHSFTVKDLAGTNPVDMADYGITIIGGNWPFVPTPHTQTVNVTGLDGGYTYWNNARPGIFSMDVILDCEEADMTTLFQDLDDFADATDTANKYQIHLDGVTDRYWIGRRISGVNGEPVGQRALQFTIEWALDSPIPTPIVGGT